MRTPRCDAVVGQTPCGKNFLARAASTCCSRWFSRSASPSISRGSLLEAGPRVQAEDQSVIRLAREFIETIVADLNEAPDPDARLNRIVGDLNRLRHVSITRQDDAVATSGEADTPDDDDDARSPPAWFVSAGSSGTDRGERADVDQWQAGIAADHLASRTTRWPRSGTASSPSSRSARRSRWCFS